MMQLTKQVWVNPVKKKHGTELAAISNRKARCRPYNDDDKSEQSGLKNTRNVKIYRASSHSLDFHSSPVAIHNIWRQVNKKNLVWILKLVYRNRNTIENWKMFLSLTKFQKKSRKPLMTTRMQVFVTSCFLMSLCLLFSSHKPEQNSMDSETSPDRGQSTDNPWPNLTSISRRGEFTPSSSPGAWLGQENSLFQQLLSPGGLEVRCGH